MKDGSTPDDRFGVVKLRKMWVGFVCLVEAKQKRIQALNSKCECECESECGCGWEG